MLSKNLKINVKENFLHRKQGGGIFKWNVMKKFSEIRFNEEKWLREVRGNMKRVRFHRSEILGSIVLFMFV